MDEIAVPDPEEARGGLHLLTSRLLVVATKTDTAERCSVHGRRVVQVEFP